MDWSAIVTPAILPSLIVVGALVFIWTKFKSAKKEIAEEQKEWHEGKEGIQVHKDLALENGKALFPDLFQTEMGKFLGSETFRTAVNALIEARMANERQFVSLRMESYQKELQLGLLTATKEIKAALEENRRDLDARLNEVDKRLFRATRRSKTKPPKSGPNDD